MKSQRINAPDKRPPYSAVKRWSDPRGKPVLSSDRPMNRKARRALKSKK